MAKKKAVTPISHLRTKYEKPVTEYYDTGIFLLNDIWNGGLPTGKIVEMHSAEGLGKTTIILQMCYYLIKHHGLKIAYLDVEVALDETLKSNMGLMEFEADDQNNPSFAHLAPYTYDEVSNSMNIIINGDYDVIVYDSIANTSLDIATDDEGKFSISKKIGQHSLLQGELLKMFKGRLGRLGKTLVVINQMRANIMTNPMMKGPALVPAGGKVLDHNFDIRTYISSFGFLFDQHDVKIGAKLRLTTTKNKVTYPYKQVELELVFGHGINKVKTLYTVLRNQGIMEQRGAYYYFPGNDKGLQGEVQAVDYVRQHYDHLVTLVGNCAVRVNVEGGKI